MLRVLFIPLPSQDIREINYCFALLNAKLNTKFQQTAQETKMNKIYFIEVRILLIPSSQLNK